MPVKECQEDGKPGYKYGDSGKCYTYTPGNEESRKRAKEKAHKQGAAVEGGTPKKSDDDIWGGAFTGLD